MKKRTLVESFNSAIEGFIYSLKTQRNMRLHFFIAVLVLVVAIYLNFNRIEILILSGTIALVLFAEMFNSAVEMVIDLSNHEINPLVKIIKDVTAGAVLVVALYAVLVGYILFFDRLHISFESGLAKLKASDWHTTFIILIVVLSLVILGKVIFHRGRPLRGGMPSGHSAFAFSVWSLTVLMQSNLLISGLVFIVAVLVARSRKKEAVHSTWEIVAGALIGILATFFVYQLLV